MKAYWVREVGTDTRKRVEAGNQQMAVADIAGCQIGHVCVPIWVTSEGARFRNRVLLSCYMPRDGSGRQWIVEECPA